MSVWFADDNFLLRVDCPPQKEPSYSGDFLIARADIDGSRHTDAFSYMMASHAPAVAQYLYTVPAEPAARKWQAYPEVMQKWLSDACSTHGGAAGAMMAQRSVVKPPYTDTQGAAAAVRVAFAGCVEDSRSAAARPSPSLSR